MRQEQGASRRGKSRPGQVPASAPFPFRTSAEMFTCEGHGLVFPPAELFPNDNI